MSYDANTQTIEMVSFATEGNIIDHSWYHIIKRHSKTKSRTDSNAIMLLADIVYWHKPTHKIDENSGIHTIHKKYKADLLQKSYADMENQFGFTKDQARSAIETLESLGIIERVFRDFFIGTMKMTNVMFIKFNHKKLLELMKEYYQDTNKFKKIYTSSEKTDDPLGKNQLGVKKKPTYTEITPKSSSSTDLIDAKEILIFDFEGNSKKITKDDIHFLKARYKKDWTDDEISFSFMRLSKHKGSIRDLEKFISAIITKNRLTQNIKQKNTGKKCQNKQKLQRPQTCTSSPLMKKKQLDINCKISEKGMSGSILARAMESL